MNVGVCGAGIFALLDCLPGMAFTLTLFRKRLRLGVRATVAVCALLVVIQVEPAHCAIAMSMTTRTWR